MGTDFFLFCSSPNQSSLLSSSLSKLISKSAIQLLLRELDGVLLECRYQNMHSNELRAGLSMLFVDSKGNAQGIRCVLHLLKLLLLPSQRCSLSFCFLALFFFFPPDQSRQRAWGRLVLRERVYFARDDMLQRLAELRKGAPKPLPAKFGEFAAPVAADQR